MGYAYTAKQPAEIPVDIPDEWPLDWNFPAPGDVIPPDFDITYPWPPGWPKETDDYTLAVVAPATIGTGSFTLEARTLLGAVDTDDLLNHYIGIVAKIGDDVIQLRADTGDAWANTLWFKAENYSGSKHGFSEALYANIDSENNGDTITFHCVLVSLNPVVTAIGNSTIVTYEDFDLEPVGYKTLIRIDNPFGSYSSNIITYYRFIGMDNGSGPVYRSRLYVTFYIPEDAWGEDNPESANLRIYLNKRYYNYAPVIVAYTSNDVIYPISYADSWGHLDHLEDSLPFSEYGTYEDGTQESISINPANLVKGRNNTIILASYEDANDILPDNMNEYPIIHWGAAYEDDLTNPFMDVRLEIKFP